MRRFVGLGRVRVAKALYFWFRASVRAKRPETPKVATRVQQIPRLRCRTCDGYGFVPVQSLADRGHQAGEETCRRCGGDGTRRDALRLAKVRPLPKQKSMTLTQLEEEVRKLVHGRELHFTLGFNESEDGFSRYSAHEWFSEADKEKALKEENVWTLEIFGKDIENYLQLASSSLSVLMQMLARYDFEAVPPRVLGTSVAE